MRPEGTALTALGCCIRRAGLRGRTPAFKLLSVSLSLCFPLCKTSQVNDFQGPFYLCHSESLSSMSFQCLVMWVIMQVKQEVG